ncbi:uncharacterized protein LOC117554629 [Gymnodraco acuticeps]|uniref:Uncharacterized protein LOC117554629 n=1 Tax=Gymnodraco acuticeps TaxID=8218 RepID=A0A6P8WBS7_GYMAC|nr:uncharacterized protein LOC117554629 [Gymnodraco acuticeps]XP_034084972.1 uncharacterized protein LOC117554629 [Gymnodraco acuticeps]XP_034084974.1 uncharacterized protein LOC117554629 [Gymnodraco acuticeps]
MDAYPKLRNGGGFELLKISGTTRSRHLIVIPCPNEGYYVRYLKDPQTQIGHSTVFIRPMQRTLNLDPACRSEGDKVLIGPNQKCVICGEEFPFSRIKDHSNNCTSVCLHFEGDPAIGDGVTRHFFATIMSKLQAGFEMKFVPGGTLLFEGEQDHLIPSTSHLLLESDFFVVAGRMIGHSFLHDGPCLGGLSPAVLHVLFGGSPEEATIDIRDCVDLDIRETIKLLEGTAELSSEEKKLINELALSWDLPLVTCDNRRWLFDKLILHAVLGRTSRQVKQLRRGLKETLIWPLLTERKDTIPLLFPRASDLQCTPRMVLEKINWPTQDEDEDSEVSLEDSCRLTGFLRTFIEMASPVILGKLVQFWTVV